MMLFILCVVVMLALAIYAFVRPLSVKDEADRQKSRDAINKAYYEYRLNEIEEDNQKGVIDGKEEIVAELQQNLLVDIPEKQQKDVLKDKPVSKVALLCGAILLIFISGFSYMKTGALEQVVQWQTVADNYPLLKAKYDSQKIDEQELADFALALRTKMQNQPENLQDLLLLGEVGMRLNSYNIASTAFEHAYRLAPNDTLAQSYYGYLSIMYAEDESEEKFGLFLLTKSLQQDPTNLFAVKALSFYYLEKQDLPKTWYFWNMWLDLLPEDSANRAMVVGTLNQIQKMIDEKHKEGKN